MFRAFFWVVKVALFSIIVLAIGNWVHWRGKTISDQVQTNIAHAEKITGEAAENAKSWVVEKKKQAENALGNAKESAQEAVKNSKASESEDSNEPEKIAPSERQKLRALIRELNGTQKRD